MGEWILIKDKMPEELTIVVVCYRDGDGYMVETSSWYQNAAGGVTWHKLNGHIPFAWMPMPKPPVVN